MTASLSIRTYTKRMNRHVHTQFHQLVLPTQGNIHIDMDGFSGNVSVGDCMVIRKGMSHGFHADEASRFMVVDLKTLPSALMGDAIIVFSVTAPLLSFIQFAEKQLEYQVNSQLESAILETFFLLLAQQELSRPVDERIRAVQSFITEQLDQPLTIAGLADVAYLSPTQFKKRFKDTFSMSVHQYITLQRMEKAKALLIHTDLPVQLIAERVGYTDLSAFSRRFSLHVGLSPRAYARMGFKSSDQSSIASF